MIEWIRTSISILLHHDAITGTNSKTAEAEYRGIIDEAEKDMRVIQWELIEKLGRLLSLRAEVKTTNNRPVPISSEEQRGKFQFSVFNPLPVAKRDFVRFPVTSNNVKLSVLAGSSKKKEVEFVLIPTAL